MSKPDCDTLVAAVTRAMENIFVVVMVDVAGSKPAKNPRSDQNPFLTSIEEPGALPSPWQTACFLGSQGSGRQHQEDQTGRQEAQVEGEQQRQERAPHGRAGKACSQCV